MIKISAKFTDNGLIIDEVFHEMPVLKEEYSKLSLKLSSITPHGEIEIPPNSTYITKDCKSIRFDNVKVPETSQWLMRDFIFICDIYPKATLDTIISDLKQSLNIENNNLRILRQQYLITVFKICKKHEKDKIFDSFLDLISFLSIFQLLEFVCINPSILNLIEDNRSRFCNRCHKLLFNSRSDYCNECRHDIRNENQKKRRENQKIKQIYCSGGCGKKLIGKQRVWCGDPKCWLKIYRKKDLISPGSSLPGVSDIAR